MKARQTKIYTPEEIAEYSATHTPHRRVVAAQIAESMLLPRKPTIAQVRRAEAAEQELESKMLHGEGA